MRQEEIDRLLRGQIPRTQAQAGEGTQDKKQMSKTEAPPLERRVGEICARHGGRRVPASRRPTWAIDTCAGTVEVSLDRFMALRFHEPERAEALGVAHFAGHYTGSGRVGRERLLGVLDARLAWLGSLKGGQTQTK
jgi:hypothetical protein